MRAVPRLLVASAAVIVFIPLAGACGSGSNTSPTTDGGTSASSSGGGSASSSSGSASSSGSGSSSGGSTSSSGSGGSNGGSTSSSGASGSSSGGTAADAGPGCGYMGQGTPLHVAATVDVCLPPVVCDPETCPPTEAQCISGKCVFGSGYQGVETFPEAWATHYCALSTGGCHGVTQIDYPEVTAQNIATAKGTTVCDVSAGNGCIGIMASSPMMEGNSQLAVDPVTMQPVANWGLGLTEASGLCYEITGPGGTAMVALTDRCGGYCKCNGSAFQECGPCANAASLEPNCPCVGTAPALYTQCCGNNCPTLNAQCDWCASNNHPHFDLDDGTFNWVCGSDATLGSCQLTTVKYVSCMAPKTWPPGGGSGGCQSGAFACSGTPVAHQDLVPGTTCCCDYNECPQTDGSCAAAPSTCKAGSCACGAGQPDASHPMVPSTGCCCTYGTTPQADGSCQ